MVIFLLILGLAFFGFGVLVLYDDKNPFSLLFILAALLLLGVCVFSVVPHEIPSGLPLTRVDKGEYKAAFVYVAGENVSVGVEKKDSIENDHERLFLYQFPKSAFDGSINPGAKKLVVVESGGFRKLVLK